MRRNYAKMELQHHIITVLPQYLYLWFVMLCWLFVCYRRCYSIIILFGTVRYVFMMYHCQISFLIVYDYVWCMMITLLWIQMCMCFFRVVSFSVSRLEISLSYQYGLSTLLVETSFVMLWSSQNQKHPFFSHVFSMKCCSCAKQRTL